MNNKIKELLQNENVIYFISDLINEKNDYKSRKEKAVKYIKKVIKPRRADTSFHSNPIYILEMTYLLNILNGDNNE